MTTDEKRLEIWKRLSDVRDELIACRVVTGNLDEDHPDAVNQIQSATRSVEGAMGDIRAEIDYESLLDESRDGGDVPTGEFSESFDTDE